jgi:glycosyltransferase involved in cell wall biosynthesis
MPGARRVTVIAHELRGVRPVGGMGTAITFASLALARQGHSVEILLGNHSPDSIDPYWKTVYESAGVRFKPVPRGDEPVEPWEFARSHGVMLGLREDPPDVAIAHDLGAPAYSALRLREAGLAFENTLFVVFCHGTRRWLVDVAPNIALGDLHLVLGMSVLEQAALELADVVVSPSAYLADWMRGRGWRLPERTLVIPYFMRSEAMGEPASVAARPEPDRLRRFAFFGRVDERKGLKTFAAALNAVEPERLLGVEVEFVGKTTASWPRDRVEALLSDETRAALSRITFESDLDQHEALARLSRPGTLTVMPAIHENSPNTVYECLEHGIPFIASNVGGVSELIAPADRERVLFEPMAEDLETALRRVLAGGTVPPPVRAAFDPGESGERWAGVIEMCPKRPAAGGGHEEVDVVVVRGESQEALLRCVTALESQTHSRLEVIVADTRQAGLDQGSAPYVVFLDEEDVPDAELVQTLLATRRATGADVVTCGLRLDDRLHFFSGDPRGFGAVTNAYGNVALYRRGVLGEVASPPRGARDPDWALLARVAAGGASIVSVPVALVRRRTGPGSVGDDPAAALEVVQLLERTLPDPLRGAVRLAAGLAADAAGR